MAISKGDEVLKSGKTPGGARLDLVKRIDGKMVFHYYPASAKTDRFTYKASQGKASGSANVTVQFNQSVIL